MPICGLFRETAFCRTELARSGGAQQPILLTVNDDNPNEAAVRFLIDGVPVPPDAASYQRIVLLFDGDDPDAVAIARDALERRQATRIRRDLLATGRARALAAQGLAGFG